MLMCLSGKSLLSFDVQFNSCILLKQYRCELKMQIQYLGYHFSFLSFFAHLKSSADQTNANKCSI